MSDFGALSRFDPDMAARLSAGFGCWPHPPQSALLDTLAGDILEAMALEPALGQALADGFTRVAGAGSPAALHRYRKCSRQFAGYGPTLGRLMATVLAPVIVLGDDGFLEAFLSVVAVMRGKGTHVLSDPLDALSHLITAGDRSSAEAYLGLLAATFSRNVSYNRTNHLTKYLPRAVLRLPGSSRCWQITHLTTAMAVSDRLAEILWESLLDSDLRLLGDDGLKTFVADACGRFLEDPESAIDFAGLRSRQGKEACAVLRTAVPLSEVRSALSGYAALRLGKGCAIRPMSDLPATVSDELPPLVCSDGSAIFLAGVVDAYPDARQNRSLYQCLVRLECGVLESGTYDFDMDKAADLLGIERPVPGDTAATDLTCWWRRYASPRLAAYLFSVFEVARTHRWSLNRYPGAVRHAAPFLEDACRQIIRAWPDHPYTSLVVWSVLPRLLQDGCRAMPAVKDAIGAYRTAFEDAGTVEDTAVFVDRVYPSLSRLVDNAASGFPELPLGRRIQGECRVAAIAAAHRLARRVQQVLAKRGVPVYRSEIVRQYRDDGNALTPEGVQKAVAASARCAGIGAPAETPVFSWPEAMAAMGGALATATSADAVDAPTFWYPEWDGRQGDYLGNHARVLVGNPAVADAAACAEVLRRRHHLVSRIKRAFELLRPQGLVLLRRWMEGDDFDYRALLDFAVDRRTGRTPSQRVYLKRLKAHRDVATLLLVDQSRSTAHPAFGTRQSVMDVEKAAIVLFCQALDVLGDRFAVAGFSGAGRFGVDYYWIKTFDECMGGDVWSRIAGMAPLRSTRMGAAIRHATAAFDAVPAAVRMLLVLGDGFPNDVDYKKGYAIEDTRKAVQEAHAKHIHTHGITVNIASDAGLDALYGGSAHTVISDVRELPDALWRIYANLTRR